MHTKHRIYIGLLIFLAIAQLVNKLASETGGFASRYIPLIFVIIIVFSFSGYLLQKTLYKRWLWIACFYLVGFMAVAMILYSIYLVTVIGTGGYLSAAVILVIQIIITPGVHVLYHYAFKSSSIWNKNK